jgi:mRNA-capping enzyme
MNKKKQDYITEIFESSKKYDCHFHAVTSEVCLEDEGFEQEGAKENENVLKNKENKPFIPDFEFATGVSCVLDDDLSARVRQRARDWIGLNFDKFPGATPVSMSRDNIRLLYEDFLVSWKADGTRYLMVILGRDQVYCIGTACDVFHIGGLTFPKSADLGDHLTDVLLDGEMISQKSCSISLTGKKSQSTRNILSQTY